jgi:hypothetical protein
MTSAEFCAAVRRGPWWRRVMARPDAPTVATPEPPPEPTPPSRVRHPDLSRRQIRGLDVMKSLFAQTAPGRHHRRR